ncbi:MAG: BtpA/SgcQ family protein [Bdellovibrionales bacterium]
MKVFKHMNGIIIGAIHFPPLPGYDGYPGLDVALANAKADLQALVDGGVDGIIVENNYDIPHIINVTPEVADAMIVLSQELRKTTSLPMGVSVLWNDYATAFAVAKKACLQFIRVPVFVDKVKTDYGLIEGAPHTVIKCRSRLGADNVAIFADVHVKHADILTGCDQNTSAQRAITAGADAIIVTGKWTGNAPDVSDVESMRQAVGDHPILIGSGVNKDNVRPLFKHATGAIVSTSLKQAAAKAHDRNVHPYESRLEQERVAELVRAVR